MNYRLGLKKIRLKIRDALNGEGEGVSKALKDFEAAGGDEDDFEDPIDWDAISNRVDNLVTDLNLWTRNPGESDGEAISIGVDPRLILSQQYFDN